MAIIVGSGKWKVLVNIPFSRTTERSPCQHFNLQSLISDIYHKHRNKHSLAKPTSMPLVKWKQTELPTVMSKGGAPPQTTLAAIESLAVPLVQEVVFLADFRCSRCQQRVAEIMSKLNGETQSVMISVLEKKVTLSCINQPADKLLRQRLASAYRSSWSKLSFVARLYMSPCS